MADEQPRSKSIKISGARKSGVIVKRIKQDTGFKNSIPSTLGEPHPTEDGLYFFDADYQPTSGGWGDLLINYSWIQNGSFETELRANVQEVLLEKHELYTLHWNYSLITSSEDTSVPLFWRDGSRIKTLDEFKALDSEGIYSLVTNMNAKNGLLVSGREKALNTYKKPTYSILETIYYINLADAKAESNKLGSITPPSDDFGLTAGNFLLTSAPITRSGGYYAVRKVYEYSDGWSASTSTVGWDYELYI